MADRIYEDPEGPYKKYIYNTGLSRTRAWAQIQGGGGGHRVTCPSPTILKMGDTISTVPLPTNLGIGHTYITVIHNNNTNNNNYYYYYNNNNNNNNNNNIMIMIIIILIIIIIIIMMITKDYNNPKAITMISELIIGQWVRNPPPPPPLSII